MPLFDSVKSRLSRKGRDANSDRSDSYSVSSTPATRRPNRPGMDAFSRAANPPPPSYTDATQQPAHVPPTASSGGVTASTAEDPYAFLSQFDTMFLIDDSGSMAGRSWGECRTALAAVAPICTQHDDDGIDIHFLNAPDSAHFQHVRDAATVLEIFTSVRPGNGTPTGRRLNALLKAYLEKLKAAKQQNRMDGVKPLNVIVVTDGVPNDDVESVIIRAAKRLDELDAEPWQLGVQFVGVGNEPGARQHLEALDDELADLGGGCRDIVDTVPASSDRPLTEDVILKIILGAVNKRLDRRRNSSAAARA